MAAEERGRRRESATGAARNIEGSIERSKERKDKRQGGAVVLRVRARDARQHQPACLRRDKPAEPEFIQTLCVEFAMT